MKKILFLFIILSMVSFASDFNGNFTTGIHMGTPYWNKTNLEDDAVIDSSDSFLRVVNKLRMKGKLSDNLSIGLNAIRSDGFQSDNRLTRTKIQQIYAAYKFSGGDIELGRIMPFNRWIMGSVDGLSVAYKLSNIFSIKALGGMNVRYGKLYDSDDNYSIAYGELGVRLKKYGGKVKFYNDEDKSKAGIDVHGKIEKLRINGSAGYNITDEEVSDGSFGMFYPFTRNFTMSGHYRFFRPDDWQIANVLFKGNIIERFVFGLDYKIFNGYSLSLRQMLALTSERTDNLFNLIFSGKYFHIGINYLTGDSDFERIGYSIGANYSPVADLNLSAGISPVDYLLDEGEEHIQSTAIYFRANYKVFKALGLRLNFNYYDNNNALNENIRGGLNITYYFGN